MDRNELRDILDQADIRADVFDLDGRDCDECLRLERTPNGWIVYYAERGLRTNERTFPNEDEACRNILKRLIDDAGARRFK
jgi:hypothetical protein